MRHSLFAFCLCALAVGQTAPTASPAVPSQVLSPDEVRESLGGKGRDHAVRILDRGLMAAQGNKIPSITLAMPDAVLAIKAELAKKQFASYEPSEEDKRRALTVVAEGYAGKTIAEGCASITRVVLLSDASGGTVEEAYLTEPLEDTWKNGFGAENTCQSLRAKFSLDSVRQVMAAAPQSEFFIAVFSGTVNTKMYKIKRKFESKLGLN